MGTELFERQGAILLARSDGCSVWQFRSGTGDGTMTVYDVFPGTMLCVNDFHMERYESCFVPDRPLLAIDHCREGRKEFSPGDDMLAYTEAGDMELDRRFDIPMTPMKSCFRSVYGCAMGAWLGRSSHAYGGGAAGGPPGTDRGGDWRKGGL